MAGIWGAGNSTIPFTAGTAHGSDVQEAVIKVGVYSSAPTGRVSFSLLATIEELPRIVRRAQQSQKWSQAVNWSLIHCYDLRPENKPKTASTRLLVANHDHHGIDQVATRIWNFD
jgi:hypothetical protein